MYDDVAPPAPAEKESWKLLPFKEAEFLKNEVGATALTGEPGYSVLERIWARPTFEVHGIAGGFTGAGAKTVIPSKATAKVSFRLVPNQNPDKILASFREFLQKNTPAGIRIELRVLSASPAVMVDPDHPAIQTAAGAFSEMFGRPPYLRAAAARFPSSAISPTHLQHPIHSDGLWASRRRPAFAQ